MSRSFSVWPEQASTLAPQVDALYVFLLVVSTVFIGLIFGLIIGFGIRYRRRSANERPAPILGNLGLELVWILIPLCLALTAFGWGARLYVHSRRPPAAALEVYGVAKQWMWKFQHPQGQREINQLHVPVGQPVTLLLTSADVIHSWFVPAFRVKMDVVPGRYTRVWFTVTRPGRYRLFCAEYCGTEHSAMVGEVVALAPEQYEAWLSQNGTAPLATKGAGLFQKLRCPSCHQSASGSTGPSLVGLFGRPVTLQSGETLVADEAYMRESILSPATKVVAGYPAVMPTYQGQLSEEALLQLLAYLKAPERRSAAP